MSRLLFLSHSGIDADAAAALRVRILASPAARERGLLVWFDKDDLRAGEPWQRQLEDAIARSHAFAVYVGSKGVVNWVEAEVRLALNRAITEPEYRFVPILAGAAPSPESLPGFAQQFQGVFDVEARPDQFDHLMRAILGSAEAGTLQLESEPFFGLRAIDETRSHLFFGRETETAGLAALVHRTPLVLVTGDSGSGKSSLVRAGLVPRFRGGGLALLDGARAQDTIWHVVTTRPRNQPLRQLGDAVDEAAKRLGLSLADRGTLADWAASGEIDKVRRGLRCGLPPERVQLLLVVDQFEELLTITPPELRTPFIDLLLELSDPADGRHRVVLTMRHDYANLCNAFERLKDRLDADDRQARFLLGRMSDQGLRRIVTEPLRLAGIDAGDREALAGEVLRDVGERPGDLALVQMALTETWRTRDQHGGDLLRAYADVGRVEGALAKAAERVRTEVLDAGQREFLDAILLRLVRLGDTGGATRRVASRGEFDAARWSLIQKLASEEGKRLLLLRGSTDQPTVEIAHEALVTAWPYFQNLLQQAADDKRILDALIPRAQAWAAEQEQTERDKRRAIGADLELFSGLLDRRATWLSGDERGFVEGSLQYERELVEKEEQRQRQELARVHQLAESERLRAEEQEKASHRNRRLAYIAGGLFIVAAGVGVFAFDRMRAAQDAEQVAVQETKRAEDQTKLAEQRQFEAEEARQYAEEQTRFARANESRALAALSEVAFNENRYVDAVKLALAAWPRGADDDRPKLRAAISALGRAQREQKETIPPLRHQQAVLGAVFNRDESRILTWSGDGTARLWNAATGKPMGQEMRHAGAVSGAIFNGDGSRILTRSDRTAHLWDAATGKPVGQEMRHEEAVRGAAFNGDESRILTWSEDGTARLWDAATGQEVIGPLRHEEAVRGAAFNGDESRILTWSEDGTARLSDAATGERVGQEMRHKEAVWGAAFNGDESRILTWSEDGTARLWDAATGQEVIAPLRHEEAVIGAILNGDQSRILTWSGDGAARLWDAATGEPVGQEMRHQEAVWGAAFNGDESRILTWSEDGAAHLWDAATGQEVVEPLRHEKGVWGAVFNNYGSRILTLSGNTFLRFGTARLWNAATGQEVLEPLRHERGVRGAVFNGDGRRILTWSGGSEPFRGGPGAARLWDATTGQEVAATLRHEEPVWNAVFNRDESRILTWSGDPFGAGSVRLWDAATGQEVVAPLRHERAVNGAVFNGDGSRVLTWSSDGSARMWDAGNGQEVVKPLRHEGAVNGATSNGDESRILTWSEDGTARLWDAATGQEVIAPLRHEKGVNGATFNADGSRILTRSDRAAHLWDAATGKPVGQEMRHEETVRGATFNADGSRILTWSGEFQVFGEGVRLWNAATGQPLRHERDVEGAVFNRDGSRILTWSGDGTARLWNAATGEPMGQEMRHAGAVSGAIFNGDGSRILTLTSSDDTARLWDTATGKPVGQEMRHEETIRGATFNADESRILTWSGEFETFGKVPGAARLWDAATGEPVGQEMRHEEAILDAEFNADQSRILTWSNDGTARLWDAATGQELTAPLRHERDVRGAVFNNDESRILTWSGSDFGGPGTARLWDISRLPRGTLLDVACGMLPDRDKPETFEIEYPDTSELEERYGIAITEPICRPGTPAPVWVKLVD